MTGVNDGLRQRITQVNTTIQRVQDRRTRGRPEVLDAVRTLDEAIALFNGSEATRELLLTAAKGYQLKGDLYLRLPKPVDALDAYEIAEELFVRAGGDSEDFGRLLHDMSVFFYEHGGLFINHISRFTRSETPAVGTAESSPQFHRQR